MLTPAALTIEQVRDRIAELIGWTKPTSADPYWSRSGPATASCVRHESDHPCPVDLDGIAALMPKQRCIETVTRISDRPVPYEATWRTITGGMSEYGKAYYGEGPTEIEARTRLLLAVLESSKGTT